MMKKIPIILTLFVLILNTKGQEVTQSDIIKADKDLYIEDVNFKDWLADSAASSTAREAGSGISLDVNALDFGGTLNKDADILGAANSISLGTVGSKLNTFQVNATGDLTYNSDANIIFSASGNVWTLDGSYWISAGGDTLASNAVVQELIDASSPQLPYNFEYTFSSTITDSRPGVGLFRYNNATIANVTEIYIDYFDANSVSKNAFLSMSDTGTIVSIMTSEIVYALYKLTGGYIDNGNYFTYKVAYQGHNGIISGLSTIDLDMSNSTGTGGGSDSTLISSKDTITLSEGVLGATGITGRFDSIEFQSGSKLANIPQNDIYLWDSVNSKYTPYPSYMPSTIYYGGTEPSGTTQLNVDFDLTATYLTTTGGSGSFAFQSYETSPIIAQIQGDNINTRLILNGGSTSTKEILSLERTVVGTPDLSGNIINITDSPTTSGTVSGAVLSATIDGTERISLNTRSNRTGTAHYLDTDSTFTTGNILALATNSDTVFRVTPDTLFADSLIAKVEAISIGGSDVITGVATSKDVMENTEVDKLQFNPTSQAYSEGTVFYDTGCKAITVYNDIPDFKEELGRGVNVRFYNNTGVEITNGTVIRSLGSHINADINFTAGIAGNGSLDSISATAIATVDVPHGQHGMATLIGQVNGLNTSAYSDNDPIYVSHAGTFTNIAPEAPLWYKLLGKVVYADDDSGAIYINAADAKYKPAPVLSAKFSRESEGVTNGGIDVFSVITNATNDLFAETINTGFIFQGDSLSPMQDGVYTLSFSYSFQGDAAQNDDWRIGVFKNGVEIYSTLRTSSLTNKGGVPFQATNSALTGDWFSFRITNTTSATRTSTFTDGVISVTFND